MRPISVRAKRRLGAKLLHRHYRRLWQDALQLPVHYPANRFNGRGIVFSAGGERLFVNLWVNLCLLRRVLKCTLPIEVWHFGPDELTAPMRLLIEEFHDVAIIDGASLADDLPPGEWRGFALKTLAIIHSGFEETLFLDTDSYPARDPSFLFDERPYRWAGACFWPDVWNTDPESAIWSVLDVPFVAEKEWQSGQLLIDKRRSWRAMTALEHVTRHFSFYDQHACSDKMLFYAVWKMLDQPYAMTPHPARVVAAPDGRLLLHQFDLQGSLLFHHRTEADWQLPAMGEEPGPSGAPHDEACREFLAELGRKWPEADRRCRQNLAGRRRAQLRWPSPRRKKPAQTGRSGRVERFPKSKWDATARQALLSPSMATPRLMTRGIEALWAATEQEALAIFRFFAALIFVDPRLADMLPLDLGTQGTALYGGWQDLRSLATLTAADRERPTLRAVHGHLFQSDRAPRLDVTECRKLQCLTDILSDTDAAIWPEWCDFWQGQLRPRLPKAPSAAPGAPAATRTWTSAPPPGKVLVLTPLKDIAEEADAYCRRLSRLTYPANRLSIGLLESDSSDDTHAAFDRALDLLRPRWRRVDIWKHDYHYKIPQGLGRWHPTVQLTRRKVLAQSRNELLRRSLRDEDWALWLDADVIDYPSDIIEQLLCFGRDILQPHCVLDYGGPTLDRNAWRDHGRVHMESLRGRELLAPLDAVGGTLLFIRADLHRRGLRFPETPYGEGNPRIRPPGQCYDPDHPGELETEGLGIMASDMGVQCWGLPELEILHRRR